MSNEGIDRELNRENPVHLSIIMPVYNSEEYVGKTIESILAQSYDNFELIIVDDGSKDRSGEICDEYATKDSRIKVFHKENEGICPTRNFGLTKATGIYIGFCDNDDLFLKDLIKSNIELAFKHNADVVRFSRRITTVKDGKIISQEHMKGYTDGFYTGEEFAQGFPMINKTGEGIWAGIYKRSFLEEHGISFDETMRFGYEDLDFVNKVYSHSPSVALNTGIYYNWIMRYAHSTSGKTDINNTDSLIKCMGDRNELMNKLKLNELHPGLWAEEISKKIYTVVRYVSPMKVKLRYKERIEFIKHFRNAEFFEEVFKGEATSPEAMAALKKISKSGYLILKLFEKKRYGLLYILITGKQRITG